MKVNPYDEANLVRKGGALTPSISNVKRIKSLHENIENSLDQVLEDCNKIGLLLLEEKEKLKHGQFTKWIEENEKDIGFGERQAQRYMRIAKNYHLLKSENRLTESDLNSTNAIIEAISNIKNNQNPDNDLQLLKDLREKLDQAIESNKAIRLSKKDKDILSSFIELREIRLINTKDKIEKELNQIKTEKKFLK